MVFPDAVYAENLKDAETPVVSPQVETAVDGFNPSAEPDGEKPESAVETEAELQDGIENGEG